MNIRYLTQFACFARTDKPLGHKLLKQNIETTVNNVMKTLRHGSHGTDVLRDATNGSPASVYATPNPLRDCDNLESPWTPVEGERVVCV